MLAVELDHVEEVRAHVGDVELVVAGVGVLLDLLPVLVGVVARDDRLSGRVHRHELGRLLEVLRRRQDLRQLARQAGVRPESVRVLPALLLRRGEGDLGARLCGLATRRSLKRATRSASGAVPM